MEVSMTDNMLMSLFFPKRVRAKRRAELRKWATEQAVAIIKPAGPSSTAFVLKAAKEIEAYVMTDVSARDRRVALALAASIDEQAAA